MDDKLKELYTIMFDDTLSKKDAKEFLQLLFTLSVKSKNEIDDIAALTKQDLNESIEFFNQEKDKLEKELKTLIENKKEQIDTDIQATDASIKAKIDVLEALIKKVKDIKATPGKDGENYVLSEEDKYDIAQKIEVPIVEKIIEKIEVPVNDTGYEIIEKINELDDNAPKIDASHIKNLPTNRIYGSKSGSGGSGTVTSVAMTVPTGLDIAGSPITTSGTLALALADGYEIPSSAVMQSLTIDFLSGIIETPADGNYLIAINIPYDFTINSMTTKSVSGSCTLTGYIGGTPWGGTANTVSTTETTQTHSSANSAVAGDDIIIKVSANSSCSFLSFTIKYTRVFG